jgi:TonB family protein
MSQRNGFAGPLRAAHSDQVSAGLERLARTLIRFAARQAPRSLAERLAEEWLADLAAQRPGWPRLRLALGCCWATAVIAREHTVRGLAAATASGQSLPTTDASHHPSFLSRRTAALLFVACLHTCLIYLLANGLVRRDVAVPPDPLQGTILPATPPDKPTPLPDPTLVRPRLYVPIPDTQLNVPAGPDAVQNVAVQEPVNPTPSPSHVVNRMIGGPGVGFPHTEDYYPPPALRTREMGAATVRVCVDGSGRLTAAPTLEQSSSSARLDAGAIKLAIAGSGHYRPTTEDGRPVTFCYPFRVRFELKD